jgi:solute carrier family 35 protein E3
MSSQGFIVLSCLIAVSVNFSTFLVIGTTSPVTYQVLGHLKTCLVLSFGYTLLHDPFTARNILGILVAIFGMALYSFFSVREGKKKSAGDALPVSQVRTHARYYDPIRSRKSARVLVVGRAEIYAPT